MKLRDCQEVADVTDVPAFEARLIRFANSLGFGIISGWVIFERCDKPLSIHCFGNTPPAFESQFRSVTVSRRDPVMRRIRRLSVPFVYDQSMYVSEQAGDLWEIQAGHGYKTGIAMAMHLPQGRHFALGVDRDQPLPRDGESLTRMLADFHLFSVHAELAAARFFLPEQTELVDMPQLTAREIEILKWTADGKSAWTVGQILSISEHTVNYHTQNVLRKLRVASKHQAAAKARALGLV